MRKMLQSKKGFTLVELMIVIVIMGILVAVAIPIYGAVTKNAEKKSCLANQNVIATNLSQYQMSGNTGDMYSWATLALTFTGAADGANAKAAPGFVALFKDGMPKCPTAQKDYKITVTNTDGVGTMTIKCPATNAGDLGHDATATTTKAP